MRNNEANHNLYDQTTVMQKSQFSKRLKFSTFHMILWSFRKSLKFVNYLCFNIAKHELFRVFKFFQNLCRVFTSSLTITSQNVLFSNKNFVIILIDVSFVVWMSSRFTIFKQFQRLSFEHSVFLFFKISIFRFLTTFAHILRHCHSSKFRFFVFSEIIAYTIHFFLRLTRFKNIEIFFTHHVQNENLLSYQRFRRFRHNEFWYFHQARSRKRIRLFCNCISQKAISSMSQSSNENRRCSNKND